MDTKRISIIAASSVAAAGVIFSAVTLIVKKFRGKNSPDILHRMKSMTHDLTLTDDQVRILRWIADGCPDGESLGAREGDLHASDEAAYGVEEAHAGDQATTEGPAARGRPRRAACVPQRTPCGGEEAPSGRGASE